MPNSRYERIDRLRSIQRQFYVVTDALGRLRLAVFDGRVALPQGTSPRDLIAAEIGLEATFLVQLWAEFETSLRSYYGFLNNDPDPQIRAVDLVNDLGAVRRGRFVREQVRLKVHEVREFRNSLVHDRDEPARPVALDEASHRLMTFMNAKMPDHWG